MITLFSVFGGLYALGAIVMLVGMHQAPEGYEDESGFHLIWKNNDPERGDVTCVWGCEPAHVGA